MKKLFWDDPYQTHCHATVVSVDGKKVTLDQSIFYAFSGGQASDEGTIGGINVVEAVKEGDKETIINIVYTLAEEPSFSVGDEVEVVIDNERRLQLMKLHSAAHIVYYILFDVIGKQKLIGSNVHPEKARMDFLYDKPINDILPSVEEKVNSFLSHGHAITCVYDTEKPDLRWWVCSSWKMPCGGTHPTSTLDIGKVKLKRENIGKGKERVEIRLA